MGEKKLTEEEQEILDAFEKEGQRPTLVQNSKPPQRQLPTRSTRPVALTCE
ncbi:MAG TPA: hypothetical protein QF604_14280 [Candidatus Latescibacteria bacterium]|jgi:hypothetical protein|nr:hypothetical protein [Candidatus Latescibacterota bacterium]MDP7635024.1 hypothetical protein [Candidatus Latescibacterota bacterium]HJN29077.1 hypothetical protein [Candidatus Latescibacterota bacterium]|tara:strand:+ start:1401 stop:1553 length:153 start_codon:yes stop_codon:yes gene_type:complete